MVRLSRAVQRAAIYPPEHPSVRLTLGPFLDSLQRLVRAGLRLLLVVMRDRLVISTGEESPQEYPGGWLASQLYSRRITSLTFDAAVDADECLGFIHWLAQPARDSADTAPAARGVSVTRLDYSRAQFDETPRAAGPEPPDAVAAWNALAVGLLAPGAPAASSDEPLDPELIARAIEADLATSEGTGVASVTGRLIKAGGGLAALPERQRRSVRERLAEVVAALPDDIRRHILAVIPDDHPDKIALLTELLDSLPRHRLLELVPRVDMSPGAHVRQFLTFLVKLVSLAHVDPAVGEAVEGQLQRYGLPGDMLQADTEAAQRLLEELFTQAVGQSTSTGERYQATLQDLSATSPGEAAPIDLSAYAQPEDAAANAAHVARIALGVVRRDPRDPTTPACLAHALDAARRDLDAGRIDLLAELAAVLDLAAPADGPARPLREECLTLCRDARATDLLMAAIDAHAGPPSEPMTALFVAAGLPTAVRAVARLSGLPDGPLRDRLGHLLASVELEVMRQAVARASAEGAAMVRLLTVFQELDPARTPELARVFLRDPDPELRRQALEILVDAPIAPVKRERAMLRAMTDENDGVVRVALRELSLHQTPSGLTALTRFLERSDAPAIEPLQTYAVETLRQTWTPAAVTALAHALRARRRAFDTPARRVSRAIVAALEGAGDERAVRAARTWRRSPAGIWSACVGERQAVPS